MKQLFCLLILAGVTLTIQSCENNGGTTGSTSCSCPPFSSYAHEVINGDIDFQENAHFTGNFFGFYGIRDSCCHNYGRNGLRGGTLSLNTKALANGTFVGEYSSKTTFFFNGAFLPTQWTLQLWINPSSSTSSGIMMEENIGNKKALFLSLTDNNKFSLNLPSSDNSMSTTHLTIESFSSLTTNTWQHIAVTVSENEVAFYINGVLDRQQSFDSRDYNHLESRSSFSSEEKRLCFGSCHLSTGDISFQGKIDNIEFISRVLSSAEILSNYQSSQSNFP